MILTGTQRPVQPSQHFNIFISPCPQGLSSPTSSSSSLSEELQFILAKPIAIARPDPATSNSAESPPLSAALGQPRRLISPRPKEPRIWTPTPASILTVQSPGDSMASWTDTCPSVVSYASTVPECEMIYDSSEEDSNSISAISPTVRIGSGLPSLGRTAIALYE